MQDANHHIEVISDGSWLDDSEHTVQIRTTRSDGSTRTVTEQFGCQDHTITGRQVMEEFGEELFCTCMSQPFSAFQGAVTSDADRQSVCLANAGVEYALNGTRSDVERFLAHLRRGLSQNLCGAPPEQGCYEAHLPTTSCYGFETCGFTCVGDYCAYAGRHCLCDCSSCSTFYANGVFNPNTGRCDTPSNTPFDDGHYQLASSGNCHINSAYIDTADGKSHRVDVYRALSVVEFMWARNLT